MKIFILNLLLILTFTISRAQTCTQSGSLIIPVGGQNTSTLPTNSYSGIDVVLEGDLIVDNNFEFIGCTLYVAANVSIIVEDLSITFTVRNSNLFSCGTDMWNGIVVKQKSGLDFSRNVIEDAKTGVYTESFFGTVKIIENTFNKNHIHFHAEKANGNNITIHSNEFTCVNSINSPGNTLESPFLNQQTDKAIWAENISNTLSIGSPNFATNNFSFAKYGILLETVAAIIKNNSFENIGDGTTSYLYNPPFPYYTPNTCILAFCEKQDGGCSIEIGGVLANEMNTVLNCDHGFETNNYKYVEIHGNRFTDTNPLPPIITLNGTGILAIGINYYNVPNPSVVVKNSIVNITNNYVDQFRTGVNYYHANQDNIDLDVLNISKNTFERTTTINKGHVGISTSGNLTSNNPSLNAVFNISDNTIDKLSTGLFIYNTSGRIANIEQNEIYVNTLTSILAYGYGIRNYNNYSPNIYDNKITGPGVSVSAFHTNFHGIYSALSDQSIIKCNKINTIGKSIYFQGSTPSEVTGNTMKHAYDGFTMGSNAVIGPQGNSSIPSDNRWQGNFLHSRTFTINTGCNSHSPLYLRSGNLFFPPVTSNLTSSFPGQEYNNSLPTPGLNLVSNPGAPLICPLNPNPQTPFLALMQDFVREKVEFDQFIPHSRWISKKQVFDAILKDSLLLADPVLDSFVLADSYQFLSLNQIEDEISNQNYGQAITLINNFTSFNLPEENYQYFYKIYSTYFSGFPLPQTDYDKLVEIAEQCPLDGGKAVFEARALRDHIDRWNYEYVDICEEIKEKSFLNFTTDHETEIQIYPNPSNGTFVVDNLKNISFTFVLLDISGREIYSNIIDGKTRRLVTVDISTGIYIYKIIYSDNSFKSGKITFVE